MANMKKEKLKTWSDEAIDTLINCFQSHECIWNVTSGDYKDQNRKSRSSQRRYPGKKLLLEISQNSQENTCARVSFLVKL